MTVHLAQAKVKTEHVADVKAGAKTLFAAIDAAAPEGIRYSWSVLPDDETFIVLVQVADGVENRIPDLPEYQALQAHLQDWIAEAPSSQPMTVVGSYRFFE
jgi:hypothetical protein